MTPDSAPITHDRSTPAPWHGAQDRGPVSVPKAALVATGVMIIAALVSEPRLVDGETGTALGQVSLHLPASYIAFAPWSGLLDTLNLLSVRQHEALGVSVLVIIVLWRWYVSRRRILTPAAHGRMKCTIAHALGSVAAVSAFVVVYATGALLPRPMARLTTADPADVVVDFHSHTSRSHDGRRSFTVEANRGWHSAAGFHAAYVTDHDKVNSATVAFAGDRHGTGDRTILLPGVEVIYGGEHVVALGSDALAGLSTADSTPSNAPQSATGVAWPVVVHTIPERLVDIMPRDASGRFGASAIELSDGAPRGIGQALRDRERVLRLADSLDLAVVAGSNNHGWGRTAVAWSVLSLPGWRALEPAALDAAIQRAIRDGRRHAVRVVMRHPVPGSGSVLGLALVAPAVAWTTLATQSPVERAVTFGWIWGAAALGALRARRRRPASAPVRRVRRTNREVQPAA